jgi:hypothetical protein
MNKLKTLAAAATLLAGVSTGAVAQEASYSPADTNRDGITSDREWREHHAPMQGEAIRLRARPSDGTSVKPADAMDYDRADQDRDGFVSRAEWDRYQGRLDQMMENRATPRVEGEASYRAADFNRDGSVSREEWERFHAMTRSR